MLRIAVCDDNERFLKDAVSMIERWSEESGRSVEIFCFDNGDDLIAKNAMHQMDIILLDIIMPVIQWDGGCKGTSETGYDSRYHLFDFINGICIRILMK